MGDKLAIDDFVQLLPVDDGADSELGHSGRSDLAHQDNIERSVEGKSDPKATGTPPRGRARITGRSFLKRSSSVARRRPASCRSRNSIRPVERQIQVSEKPLLCQPHDAFKGAGLFEEVGGSGNDLQLGLATQPAKRRAIEREHVRVGAASINRVGALTSANAAPARSGRPPRDTMAATSPRCAAATRAAAAPVLAPK